MTIEDLYEWAKAHKCEEYDICMKVNGETVCSCGVHELEERPEETVNSDYYEVYI